MQKIKICHVITSLNSGGAENYLVAELQNEYWKNMSVDVVYFAGDSFHVKTLQRFNIKTYFFDRRKITDLLSFYMFLFKSQHDLVHAHLPFAELLVFLSKIFFCKFKCLLTRHNDRAFTKLPFFVERIIWKCIEKCYSEIIVISESVAKFFCLKKYKLLEYGLYTNVKITPNQLNNRIQIGMAGRIVKQKRYDLALKVIEKVTSKVGNVTFIIAGDGTLRSYFEDKFTKKQLASKVTFLGQVSNMDYFYNNIDLFLLTSENEGFGRVLLEAMSYGKPIIAFDISSVRNIVSDSCGLFARFPNTDDLADAIIFLCSEPKRSTYSKMSKASLKRIKNYFDPNEKSKQLQVIYKNILN